MNSHLQKTFTLISFLCFFWAGSSIAQTPGGVSTNPRIWLKANSGTTPGTKLSTWENQSNDSIHTVQPVLESQPSILNNTINYNSSISFDGNNDYLAIENLHYNNTNQIQNLVVFTVFKTDYNQGGTHENWSFLDFDRSEYFNFFVRPDNGRMGFAWTNHEVGKDSIHDNYGRRGGLNNNSAHLGVAIFDGDLINDTKIRVDGYEDYSADRVATGNYIGTGTNRFGFVGDGSESGTFNDNRNNKYYHGEIAEIIYFQNQNISATDIEKIESYLAVKYGMSLEHNYLSSSGTLIWDYNTYSTYSKNIVGIGRDDASALHQSKSQNADFNAALIIENTSGFTSNENFLVIGSDNRTGIQTTGVPPGYINKSSRTWRVEETGSNSNYTVQFLLNKLGIPNTGLVTDYALFYNDNDTDFTSGGVLNTNATLSGDTLTFTGIDLNDGYMVLASQIIPPFGASVSSSLWFRADAGITEQGKNIETWQEQSAGIYNAVQNSSDKKPKLKKRGINFKESVSFDGNDDYLAIENKNYKNSGEIENMVVFTVFQTDFEGGESSGNWSFLDFDRSEYFNFYVRGDNGQLGFSNTNANNNIRDNYSNTGGLNDNRPHLGVAIYSSDEVLDTKLRIDGQEDLAIDRESTGIKLGSGNHVRYGFIGDGSEASTFNGDRNNIYYNGEIAEIIYFENQDLSMEDIYKIESYLGLKYNLTLNHDYLDSDGTVIWDYDLDTRFNQNIAGIGRDDVNDWHFRQNQIKDEVLYIGHKSIDSTNEVNPNNFNSNQSFLVWGNNGESTDSLKNDSLPNGVLYRVARTWLAQESGNVGITRLRFDASGLLNTAAAKTNGLTHIGLLVDVDGDFTTGASLILPVSLDISSNTVEFDIDFSPTTGYYFTFTSIDPLNTLLPVELLSFEANLVNSNQVSVEWTTASEVDFDHFEVERSQDGINWEFMASVSPLKGEEYPKNYRVIDQNPFTGVSYYRLIEVNNKKESQELATTVILIEGQESEVKLYPNPTHGITYLEASVAELRFVRIYNAAGFDITQQVPQKSINDTMLELDFTNFSSGTYVVKTAQITKTLQRH